MYVAGGAAELVDCQLVHNLHSGIKVKQLWRPEDDAVDALLAAVHKDPPLLLIP